MHIDALLSKASRPPPRPIKYHQQRIPDPESETNIIINDVNTNMSRNTSVTVANTPVRAHGGDDELFPRSRVTELMTTARHCRMGIGLINLGMYVVITC